MRRVFWSAAHSTVLLYLSSINSYFTVQLYFTFFNITATTTTDIVYFYYIILYLFTLNLCYTMR